MIFAKVIAPFCATGSEIGIGALNAFGVGVEEGFGAVVADAVGAAVAVAVGVGAGVAVAVGVADGIGETFTPLFQTNFDPDLTHVYFTPLLTDTKPFFEHVAPAFGAAPTALSLIKPIASIADSKYAIRLFTEIDSHTTSVKCKD